MRNFSFEYTDTKFISKLFGVSFIVAIVLLFITATNAKIFGIWGTLILTMGIPFLIFVLNKKKIKKFGTVNIFDSYSEFILADYTDNVIYANIRTYQIERTTNGPQLRIKFNEGNEFKLQANSNFCNDTQFDLFCQEFEILLQKYKTENNIELIRMPSIFERAWMLPFLIILTAGLIGFSFFAIFQGKSIPPAFFTSIGIILPMWIGYINARKKS